MTVTEDELSTEELLSLWPRTEGELLSFIEHLESEHQILVALQIKLAMKLARRYIRSIEDGAD